MKKFLIILICMLIGTVSARDNNRRSYDRRIYQQSGRHYNYNYRRSYRSYHRGSSIDRDLNRIATGVNIIGDIVGIYNSFRNDVVYTQPVVVQPAPVIYQQSTNVDIIYRHGNPVVVQQQPIVVQPPVIILQSGAVIK
ncbi:MAG: hypothetical protein PHW93_07440 [Candidatus Methanomethylophilaceae archaeon]|nr:hypothetical protein [Candidatus Methanomethylophilaceae archaeon]